jgi:glycosyltransferase involved in cell wall biosynthesis
MSAVARRIAILGTRGIPASYSGFETSVEETAARFAARGHDTTVYCRRHHYTERPTRHRGSRLVFLPSLRSKHLDTISHTLLSVLHLLTRRADVAILYGVGNSPFIPLLEAFGIRVISVLDGADWRRDKWSAPARAYLKAVRRLAVRASSHYVVDNLGLAEDYRREFGREATYIPYGARTTPELADGVLAELGLVERGYVIFVGRFVREKRIEMLLEAFAGLATDKRLVVVGGNPLDPDYVGRLRALAGPQVVFPGMVYGARYETLLARAAFYVSCSGLEGTSPSLLSAMALCGYALVADIAENRETLQGTCATFAAEEPADLRAKLAWCLAHPEEIERERERTRAVVREHYDWDRVADRYLDLVERSCRGRG